MFTKKQVVEHLMKENNWTRSSAIEELQDISIEDIHRGYGIFTDSGDVPMAESIQKIDCMQVFEDDEAAAKQAEKDGIKIIRDIKTDSFYLDTLENRIKVESFYHSLSK